MNKNFSVGLDIGTTKIVAMVGEKNQFNKVKVIGVGKSQSLGVHRGVVNNITQTIQSIKIAVDEAQSRSGIEVKEVAVGIAGQHIRSLQHSDYITRENPDEVINDNDIDKLIDQVYKLVMLPGEEIIHVLPQDFKVDGQSEIKEPIQDLYLSKFNIYCLINNNKKILPTLKSRCLNYNINLNSDQSIDIINKILDKNCLNLVHEQILNHYITPGSMLNLLNFATKNDFDLKVT